MSETIIIVGPTPPPIHGAARVTSRVVELARTASGPGQQVLHVSTSGTGWEKTIRCHLSRLVAYLGAVRVMLRWRIAGSVTVYVAGAGGLGLLYQASLIGLARILGCRTVFHHHSWSYLGGQRSRSIQFICWIQRPFDAQIMLTSHMAKTFGESYATSAELFAVSNAFAVDSPAESKPDREEDAISLVHVSNLSSEKGTDLVLEALYELRERNVACTLTLIGATREKAIEDSIEALQQTHPGFLEYLGEKDQAGVAEVLDRSHLMVFPSAYRNEAEPMVVLEALAHGVPVLVTKRGSMVTMVPPGWQLSRGESVADGVERMLRIDWNDLSQCARARHADMQQGEDELLRALGISDQSRSRTASARKSDPGLASSSSEAGVSTTARSDHLGKPIKEWIREIPVEEKLCGD